MSLQPVTLQVCGPCRAGDLSGDFVEGCAICAVIIAATDNDFALGGPLVEHPADDYRARLAAGARTAEGSALLASRSEPPR